MGVIREDKKEIKLEDEVEGEHIGSDDYCFIPVGEPVPIMPGDHPEYDFKTAPLRPLAVSEQFGLVFVAHSNGFFVARTKEVIQIAKDIKEKKSGLSLKESCILDVPIGKVYILALSADSSTLAASIEGEIHFFLVSSLFKKEQSPFFSCSLGNSSSVKDMQWTKRMENHYVVLSNLGKLYYGAGQDPLKHVMDNVDAVEWSVNGKFLAAATNNALSIMSSKFKEKINISLTFESWIGDSGFDGTVKVDSIRWIRPDCIILGCFQLSADGTEENYLIQVVTSKHSKITDASSQPILLSFNYVFEGLIDDIVPYGSGPYMSLGYVDKCELAIAANRKNTDQHIVLLGWPLENEKRVAVIDILRDTLRPKISLQENGDDNILLGISVDKVTYNDKVEVVIGADYKELSPFCLLLCLSLDGKLSMFQVASATGVSALSEDASILSEEEDDSPTGVYSENGSSDSSSYSPTETVKQPDLDIQSPEVNKKELYTREGQFSPKETNEGEYNSKNNITEDESKFYGIKQVQDTAIKQLPFSKRQSTSSASYTTAAVEDFGKAEKQELLGQFSRKESTGEESSKPFNLNNPITDNASKFSGNKQIQGNQRTDVKQSTPSAFLTTSTEDAGGDFGKEKTQDRPNVFSSQSFPTKSTHLFAQPTSLFPESAGRILSEQSFSTSFFPQSASRTISEESGLGRDLSGKLGSATLKAAEDRKSAQVTPSPPSGLSSSYKQSNSSITSSANANFGTFSSAKSTAALSTALPANRKSIMPSQSFTSNYTSKDQRPADKDNNRINSTGRLLNSEPRLSKQFGNVEEMIKELETLLECIEGPGGYREACTVLLDSSVLKLEEGMGTLFGRWKEGKRIMDEQLVEVQSLRDKTVQVAAKKFYMEGIVKQATDGQYWELWNRQKLSPELEIKRQRILKMNQELTSQLIELERHLNTLEIKAFGEDRGQMRQKGFTGRYGSSRQGPSIRSLQDIMSSQLAAAEQLSESLSRQMTMLSVESPPKKKKDARRELFEEIGIPYINASFGSPEKKRAIDTPLNKKVLLPLSSDDVNGSSRRNQLSAIKSLGADSPRRRRDSLDRSWASFDPPKTTVKREARRTPTVDRSSLLVDRDRSIFSRPEQSRAPATTVQSSNDRGISKQAFETSSPLAQAYKKTEFSKRLPEPTFSLSKRTNEISDSNDKFGTVKNGPDTSSLFSQSRDSKSTATPSLAVSEGLKSDNATNKNKSQSGLFAPSSSPFSIFGSSSSLNSSLSVSSTSQIPSLSPISAADSLNKSSTSRATVVPSQSSVSSPTVFTGSSFKLNSSFSIPSTAPTPSIAPLSPAISFGDSLSGFKASTTDSKAVLPSQSSVSSSSKVSEKTVPSLISTPSIELHKSLAIEAQPPKPEVSSKVEENKPEIAVKLETSIPSSTPTSETLFQSAINPSLNASKPGSGQTVTKNFLSPAVQPDSKIGKTENQDVMAAQEDDMEEEAPETSLTNQLNLGGLGGFGLGSSVNSSTPKQNPFGSNFANAISTPVSPPMSVPTGELFRPPTFSYQSPTTQPPQPTGGFGAFSGGFGTGNTVQSPEGGGFGQPTKIGAGQQALGSVLGSFGQSRQFGNVQPAAAATPVGFGGGSGSSPSSGGFAGIASGGGGGFASLASGGGGFAGAAGGGFAGAAGGGFAGASSPSVGGFSGFGGAAAPSVGGFASVASGFAGAAPGGGGFGGAAPGGGFGAFNSQQQGSGGFSSFGNSVGGTGNPPPPSLFTQMRR